METDIIVFRDLNDSGTVWCWRFTVHGETVADGTEETKADAERKAKMARIKWEDRNIA